MIHCIGDSHCLYTFFHLPQVVHHHLGSVRMWDVVTRMCPLPLDTFAIQPGDKCIFSFGEIDVRCDFHQACDDPNTVGQLVKAYLYELWRSAEIEGVEFWLMEVLPTAYYNTMPDAVRDHPVFPYIGSDEERARYTAIMNRELSEQGKAAGYHVLRVHHRYADDKGMMRPELASYMHVETNQPVLAEMIEAGLYGQAP